VVEVAAHHLERVGVEDDQQLVVVQAQQLLQARRAQNSWFSSRRDGVYRRVSGSVDFAGETPMPSTLAVTPGAGAFGMVR